MNHQVERRAGYVEVDQETIREIQKHIAEESYMFRSVKLASAVFATLITVVAWVLVDKNNDIKASQVEFKAMQAVINLHSVQQSETLTILKATVEATTKTADRLERHLDSVAGQRR